MGNPYYSKKAFLYFGGAAILLLGGFIVVVAPYHATGYIAMEGDTDAFSIWDDQGFYPQLEIGVLVQPRFGNGTVDIDLTIKNNDTLEETGVNITLTYLDRLLDVEPQSYEQHVLVNLEPGNYTIHVDDIVGASDIELNFTQMSDSRLFIVIGGSMNIIGLIMGAIGYCIGGTLIPSAEDTVIEYGVYEPRKDI